MSFLSIPLPHLMVGGGQDFSFSPRMGEDNIRCLDFRDCGEGLDYPFQGSASFGESSNFRAPSNQCGEEARSFFRDRSYASKKGHRGTSSGQLVSGFLFPNFSGPQKIREMETNHRSKCPQHLDHKPSLQDGDSPVCHIDGSAGPVGILDRPSRCLLSRSHQQKVQEVPQVHFLRPSVPVPGSTFRYYHSSPGFHQTFKGSGFLSARARNRYFNLFRRLPSPKLYSGSVQEGYPVGAEYARPAGLHSFGGEIRNHPIPGLHFPGIPVSNRAGGRPPSGGQISQSPRTGYPVLPVGTSYGALVPQGPGVPQLHSRCCPPGSTPYQAVAGHIFSILGPQRPRTGISLSIWTPM